MCSFGIAPCGKTIKRQIRVAYNNLKSTKESKMARFVIRIHLDYALEDRLCHYL